MSKFFSNLFFSFLGSILSFLVVVFFVYPRMTNAQLQHQDYVQPTVVDSFGNLVPALSTSPAPTPSPTPSASSVVAAITPSRSDCASPCTVVLSAEDTTVTGLDENEVFGRDVAFHWDFDTDSDRTYGALYDQEYTYVDGDTAFEEGHAPLVTKTFLCDTGTCVYNVGVRAQDRNGEFDDAYQTITVRSQSLEWSAADTICVSNTLDVLSDWTTFDDACPSGANKQSVMVGADGYNGKLVLLHKGDVFAQNLAIDAGASNFKLGAFGDSDDSKPEIDGNLWLGVQDWEGPDNAPTEITRGATDASIASYGGWPENMYIEGVKVASVSAPMSFQHLTLHDIDMDREAYQNGGFIELTRNREFCFTSSNLSCSNVPFAKGMYISKVDIVGSLDTLTNTVAVNVVGISCDLTNYLGMTDTRIRKVGEHNVRIMGYYRLSIMRSQFRGQHYGPGKQKLTIRACMDTRQASNLVLGQWQTNPDVTQDILNRFEGDIGDPSDPAFLDGNGDSVPGYVYDGQVTRAVAEVGNAAEEYFFRSRYQVLHANEIGDPTAPKGYRFGSTKYQTNAINSDGNFMWNIILSSNIFQDDAPGIYTDAEGVERTMSSSSDYGGEVTHGACVDNTLTGSQSSPCMSPDFGSGDPNNNNVPPSVSRITATPPEVLN